MFSWLPIHKETAERLLQYENRQEELIALLRGMEDAGLNVVQLADKISETKEIPLQEIDPLTFMAVFNRPNTFKNRCDNWAYVKKAWNLKADVPRDVNGIPTISSLSAWFFPWKYRRSPDDIPSLWKLARAAVEGRWDEVDPQLFQTCLGIHTVGIAKLTTGLFWLAPTEVLALPATTTGFLTAKGIDPSVSDKASYDRVLSRVRSEISPDFVAVSHDAWLHSAAHNPDDYVLDADESQKIWQSFRAAMPDFIDFFRPGAAFEAKETHYKRAGLEKFNQAGGRAAVEQFLAKGQPVEALKLFQRTVALNIASYQSWRPSMGEDRPEALADVLAA